MKRYRDLIQLEGVALGLGFFDGVHKGHKTLISQLVDFAKSNNTQSVVVTFQKSPAEMFSKNVEYIFSPKNKADEIEKLGVDYLIELDFNEWLKNMTNEEYLRDVLYKNFKPQSIFTGFNHTFGKHKEGTPEYLRANQSKYGYEYHEIAPVREDNQVISSSAIKHFLKSGNIESANKFLGRLFSISGEVIEGNKIGRTIGFPTANILYPESIVKIPFGVYSVELELNQKRHKGMLNYGIKPSIKRSDKTPIVEVHILDFNQNIYGENIKIFFKSKIREERRFNSLDELKLQIREDLKSC
jgi:riboflavin kinase/FMN adenylyltransferase